MNAIKTEKLTKYYGKNRGIIEVDLTVPCGDFFGFIGPNGAGKSTLIRKLLGLIQKSGGSAEIFGKNVEKHRIETLKRIGYLPSENSFYKDMKVRELLEFSARARGLNCKKEADILCQRLELDPEKRIKELSFGNRKKAGIVCALQHKPDLYILDEPTGGLDPLMQKEFYDILKERNEEGATVFLSSHLLFEISRYCKHAAVIREGRLLVSDSVEKLGHTGAKKVTLRGIGNTSALEGFTDLQIENGTARFLYDQSPRDLLALLSTLHFEDFSIEDPSLDEIFLHYYEKEEA